ncbi:Uncharacterised protein [Shigella flexneri]|nr:Uncharacterised protein [Shigella flexneri]
MCHTAAFLPGWRGEQRIAELIRRVIRRNPVGKDRDEQHDGDVNQPDDRAFVAFKIVPELL